MGHKGECLTHTNLDALRQLLGCYFHQDWPDEFDSDVAVAIAMVTNEPAELIAKGILEIDSLLRGGFGEDELRTMVIEQTGCCFEPMSEELGYTQWLHRLRGNLKARERGL